MFIKLYYTWLLYVVTGVFFDDMLYEIWFIVEYICNLYNIVENIWHIIILYKLNLKMKYVLAFIIVYNTTSTIEKKLQASFD